MSNYSLTKDEKKAELKRNMGTYLYGGIFTDKDGKEFRSIHKKYTVIGILLAIIVLLLIVFFFIWLIPSFWLGLGLGVLVVGGIVGALYYIDQYQYSLEDMFYPLTRSEFTRKYMRRWTKEKAKYFNSPEGKTEAKIQNLEKELTSVEEKLNTIKEQLSQGKKFQTKINQILRSSDLLESHKAKHLARKKNLEETLHIKEMLQELYRNTQKQLNVQKKNYLLEQEALSIDEFLYQSNQNNISETGKIEASHTTMELLNEITKFENEIPDLANNLISQENREVLIDRIKYLSEKYFEEKAD